MTEHQQKYHEYLLSPEWKEFRKKAFEHYGKKCAHCKRTKKLQIHHDMILENKRRREEIRKSKSYALQ